MDNYTSNASGLKNTRLRSFNVSPPIILAAFTLLALILRLYKLDFHDYRDDEIITMLVIHRSLEDILFSLADYSTNLPLYYVLIHFWRMLVGESLNTLRLFSVLLGTLGVPLLYAVGSRLVSRPVALGAAGLLALSPAHIAQSQQIRGYPLMLLLLLAAVWLFIAAWKYGGWQRWLAFGLVVATSFYTHVYVPFSILAFDAWALLVTLFPRLMGDGGLLTPVEKVQAGQHAKAQSCKGSHRIVSLPGRDLTPPTLSPAFFKTLLFRRWVGLIAAQLLGVVLFLPFVPQMLRNVDMPISNWFADNTPFDWLPALVAWSNGATMALNVRESTGIAVVSDNLAGIVTMTLALVVVLLTLITSGYEARRKPAERGVWVLLHSLIWTPIVVATVIALTIQPMLLNRYFIGIMPPLYLMIAWLAVRFWQQRRVQVLAVLFVGSMLVNLSIVYPNQPQQNDRIRLSNWLVAQQQPGDAIAYNYWHMFDTMVLTHPELENLYLVPGPVYTETFWQKRAGFLDWHTPDHIQPIEEFAPHYERIWWTMTIYDQDFVYHQQTTQAWLETHGRLVEEFDFAETTVYVYEIEEKKGTLSSKQWTKSTL